MNILRWKSGWPVAALSVVAVAVATFFFALQDEPAEPGDQNAAAQLVAAQQLTDQVRVELSAPQLDSASGRQYVHATVTNVGNQPLTGPIVVMMGDGQIADPDGQFDSGKDYVTLVPEGKKLEPRRRVRSRRIRLSQSQSQRAASDRSVADSASVWKALAVSSALGGGSSSGGVPSSSSVESVAVASAPVGGGMQPVPLPPEAYPIPDQRIVDRVSGVQNAWNPRLFAVQGVNATSTGLTPDGEVVVRVRVENQNTANNLPRRIDGVRVEAAIGSTYQAYFQPPPQDKLGQGGVPAPRPNPLCTDDAQVRFARPVPIGVSGMVSGQGCFSGTIGARVRGRDGRVFALSNNHVIAAQNAAAVGDPIVQPSLGDGSCQFDPADVIGRLADFEPVRPVTLQDLLNGTIPTNVIDAAIAEVSEQTLSNSTPCSGYGAPNSSIVPPVLGMKVEKYGRTTSFQTGRIIGVNATTFVGFTIGPALFVNQIEIIGTAPVLADFGQPGDSGSLIVTAFPNLNPVGLLFAGGPDFIPGVGIFDVTLANPIGPVLERFNVTIDGAPSNFGPSGR